MRTAKRILMAALALITSATLASTVPVPMPVPQGCPPVVVKNFPHARRVLLIENGNETIAVFCGHGPGRTITQGDKVLVILYARCTDA